MSSVLIFSLVSIDQWRPLPQLQQVAVAQEWYSQLDLCMYPGDKLRYVGPGITIRYPCDWRELSPESIAEQGIDPSGLVIALVSPQTSEIDPYVEALEIYATKIDDPYNTPLDWVANEQISYLQSNATGFTLTDSTPTTISQGKPAHTITYTMTDPNAGTIQQMNVLTIDGDEVYSILFTSTPEEFDSYLPTVQWMLSSESLEFFNLQTYLTPGGTGPDSDYAPSSPPDRIITPDCAYVTDGTPCYE